MKDDERPVRRRDVMVKTTLEGCVADVRSRISNRDCQR